MNKFALPIAVIAIIVAVGVVTYTLGTNQGGKGPVVSPTPTVSTISETPAPTNKPIITPQESANKNAVIENIEASVKSKNYAAFEGYMANEVLVILYATE